MATPPGAPPPPLPPVTPPGHPQPGIRNIGRLKTVTPDCQLYPALSSLVGVALTVGHTSCPTPLSLQPDHIKKNYSLVTSLVSSPSPTDPRGGVTTAISSSSGWRVFILYFTPSAVQLDRGKGGLGRM